MRTDDSSASRSRCRVEGIYPSLLTPRANWDDAEAYDRQARTWPACSAPISKSSAMRPMPRRDHGWRRPPNRTPSPPETKKRGPQGAPFFLARRPRSAERRDRAPVTHPATSTHRPSPSGLTRGLCHFQSAPLSSALGSSPRVTIRGEDPCALQYPHPSSLPTRGRGRGPRSWGRRCQSNTGPRYPPPLMGRVGGGGAARSEPSTYPSYPRPNLAILLPIFPAWAACRRSVAGGRRAWGRRFSMARARPLRLAGLGRTGRRCSKIPAPRGGLASHI